MNKELSIISCSNSHGNKTIFREANTKIKTIFTQAKRKYISIQANKNNCFLGQISFYVLPDSKYLKLCLLGNQRNNSFIT